MCDAAKPAPGSNMNDSTMILQGNAVTVVPAVGRKIIALTTTEVLIDVLGQNGKPGFFLRGIVNVGPVGFGGRAMVDALPELENATMTGVSHDVQILLHVAMTGNTISFPQFEQIVQFTLTASLFRLYEFFVFSTHLRVWRVAADKGSAFGLPKTVALSSLVTSGTPGVSRSSPGSGTLPLEWGLCAERQHNNRA